ncbi:SPOSA6832_00738, partial [Sporobolomyces salmonicolor]
MPSGSSSNPTSQILREQGNAAFRSERWSDAVDIYTQAIRASTSTEGLSEQESEHFAALYSNRAAARIHLFEYDLALLDAALAAKLQPKWSRAKAREGEAFTRLHNFEEARSSYAIATDLAEDDATRARCMSASASAKIRLDEQARQDAHPHLVAAEGSLEFAQTFDTFIKNCGDPKELVSASTAVYSWTMVVKAFEEMDDQLNVLDSGEVEASSPSPVLDIADAVITDSRGFHLPKGKDHKLPLSEKLRLQLSWDARVLEIDRFIKPNVVPRDVIDFYDAQVEKEGWQKVKVALAHLIRGSFVAAFVNELQARTGVSMNVLSPLRSFVSPFTRDMAANSLMKLLSPVLLSAAACSQYRFVLGLLQEGRERWADVPEDDKGSTFRFTFERKVKMHLVESLVDGHFRSKPQEGSDLYPMIDLQGLAEEIMDDCQANKAEPDPVSTFAFQAFSAGKAFAYSLRHRAQLEENRIDFPCGYWMHGGMSKACAKLCAFKLPFSLAACGEETDCSGGTDATAGSLLPKDDPERAVNLFNALAFDLRAGGVTFRTLFSRAAEAEAALVPPEQICTCFSFSPAVPSYVLIAPICNAVGPSSRRFDSRLLVRTVCTAVHAHLASQSPFLPDAALDQTIKPVPTVISGEIPEGKTWEECVDAEIMSRLEGDLAVAEVISLQ